ncbi:uncharacterized protein LOC136042325 isoform X2 [Artemia franciscana]|uniref:uncharacterized protein LOC136042325 isoform X2 n=1 Tax=Artemia franciscana TaxID=6661 RepID=UPI0032D9EAF6
MMVIEKHRHCCYIVCIINVCLVYCMLFISWNCDTLPVDSQKPEAKKSANRGGLMDSASILDIIRWHQWNNLGACRDIKFFGGHIWRSSLKHRVVMDGHKALCFDKNVRPLPGNCLIYSFGINSDWSYDADLAEYGCEVHSFDPSIEEPPQIGRNKFYFHKIGLDGRDYVNPKGWQMMTLKSIMKLLGHENRVVDAVKMDIEESEYEAVPNMILTAYEQALDSADRIARGKVLSSYGIRDKSIKVINPKH